MIKKYQQGYRDLHPRPKKQKKYRRKKEAR